MPGFVRGAASPPPADAEAEPVQITVLAPRRDAAAAAASAAQRQRAGGSGLIDRLVRRAEERRLGAAPGPGAGGRGRAAEPDSPPRVARRASPTYGRYPLRGAQQEEEDEKDGGGGAHREGDKHAAPLPKRSRSRSRDRDSSGWRPPKGGLGFSGGSGGPAAAAAPPPRSAPPAAAASAAAAAAAAIPGWEQMSAAERLRARVKADLARAKERDDERRQTQLEAHSPGGDGDGGTTWREPRLAAADVEAAFAAQYGIGEEEPGGAGDDAEWRDAAAAAAASRVRSAARGHGIRRGEAGHEDAIFGTARAGGGGSGSGLLDEEEGGSGGSGGGGGALKAAAAALAPGVLAAQSGLSWRERAALARAKSR
ncbi:hypothetical protein Rsub_06876 [Raphidocelis subcapitata]|uniref:Uncharacterized protein n=1 Tax=Raphidocelis subcapitata TaxID=307507 RepID=A0A2V0P9N5_9CHLO|nr:hypothetical protein Rsub_06876 [Raphidocelis subcapitata]|eukprot:GBF93877.1 hypothetical protein Rsub_06876 [Raphidocelis subcapitata]